MNMRVLPMGHHHIATSPADSRLGMPWGRLGPGGASLPRIDRGGQQDDMQIALQDGPARCALRPARAVLSPEIVISTCGTDREPRRPARVLSDLVLRGRARGEHRNSSLPTRRNVDLGQQSNDLWVTSKEHAGGRESCQSCRYPRAGNKKKREGHGSWGQLDMFGADGALPLQVLWLMPLVGTEFCWQT